MDYCFDKNWTTDNNNAALEGAEVERYISAVPSKRQLAAASKPFYAFVHFGMNTATGREWGSGKETVSQFDIEKINPAQWVTAIKASGATGIILTCKHHDGFCLWNTAATDFNVMNSKLKTDIVKLLSKECAAQGMDFGVYLSPWDMHDSRYGKSEYNDYFCEQLTELLTGYGKIFEVWFDGAKGRDAVDFEYDWERYYKLVRELQPDANIAICGPDIRWIGNEAGKTRNSEFSVVPSYLRDAEKTSEKSQHGENEAGRLLKLDSKDEDLGSRSVLSKSADICWYPAEVDVSIRKGWFYSPKGNITVKSVRKLFNIYLTSVGNNCSLLLNIPPDKKGVIHKKEVKTLKRLGRMIASVTAEPVLTAQPGKLSKDEGFLDFDFKEKSRIKYAVISEDITQSQRVEVFELFIKKADGTFKPVYKGTNIGSKKIIKIGESCTGIRFIIRQSRSAPIIKEIGFYK